MSKGAARGSHSSSPNGVLILECLDKTDPGSEGRFLSHMFNLMEVPSQYVEIRNKRQFLAMLGANPFDVVHITTHGHITKEKESFIGFWTPAETVCLADFPADTLKGRIVISTACKSGIAKFGKPFIKQVSARYYVAPTKNPRFHNAIYFAHWFYHNVFILSRPPLKAIKKYHAGYKNPHDFVIFSPNTSKKFGASSK